MNELLPAPSETDPTVELIHQLEDRLRQRAVDAGVTHEPINDDLDAVEHVDGGGEIVATRQRFKVGTPDSSAPVEGVYSWLNVTVTTSEKPESLGAKQYEITDTPTMDSARRNRGPVRWSDGDDKITQRVITPRGARVNALTDGQIGQLLDRVDSEKAVVVDLSRSKIVERWQAGRDGLEYMVSQVVQLEEPEK